MEQENLYDSSCTTLILVKLIPCEEEMCLIVLIMHLSTKQLTVAINFHSMGGRLWKLVAISNCVVVNILQNIFYV